MFSALVRPWLIIGLSTGYLGITVIKLVFTGDLGTLFSWRRFNDAWFSNFWKFMGPRSRDGAKPWVMPLLQGRITGGVVKDEAVHPPIEGVVLEVGAGSGMWTGILADVVNAAKASSTAIPSKIYGVEPNPHSAALLTQCVEEVGLKGTYEVVPVGIEDMHKEISIEPESVDCVMTVQCLCSIPEPEKNIQLVYNYLKKGGRWYMYEHVKSDKSFIIRWLQSKQSYSPFHPFFPYSYHVMEHCSNINLEQEKKIYNIR